MPAPNPTEMPHLHRVRSLRGSGRELRRDLLGQSPDLGQVGVPRQRRRRVVDQLGVQILAASDAGVAHDRVGLAWLRGRVAPSIAADEAIRDEETGLRLLEADKVYIERLIIMRTCL